jgi:hypothetical protein
MTSLRRLLPLALAATLVVACSSAGAPPVASPVVSPPPASGSGDGATSPGDPGAGPNPNAPVGIVVPPAQGGGFDPNAGPIVVPKPGQLDVRPISAQSLTATVTGRHVVVSIAYASGVEPCSILDSIVVRTGPGTFEITLREGHGPGEAICPDIAEFKRATVDLGELAPGTYTISDGTGGAKLISVAVA